MSHEQSETIQGRDKRWYNIYGQGTGADQPIPLPQLFNFEQSNYTTAEEAANKAAWRSHLGEGHYPTQPPQYGFTNTYQPSPQAMALGRIVEALQDPRNAWLGMGTIRGLGRLRGRLLHPRGPDTGGFNVPTSQMRRDIGIPPFSVEPKMMVPSVERAVRDDYLGTVKGLNDAQLIYHPLFQRTVEGQQALASEVSKLRHPDTFREVSEGPPTPDMIRRIFGPK